MSMFFCQNPLDFSAKSDIMKTESEGVTMKLLIEHGRVLSGNRFLQDCPILTEGDAILAVGSVGEVPKETPRLSAEGLTVLPGLVDMHTHGRAGYDFTTATREQMMTMKRSYAEHGVTTVFATLASAEKRDWLRAVSDIEACGYDGIHLEGRYLNPVKRGAHNPALLVPLDPRDLEDCLNAIHIPCHVTAAYELDADGGFAACAKAYGATLGLGHSNATAAETRTAVSRGADCFTHLYNAMPPLHHREGGAVCVALTDDLWTELIVDGLHICPDMVRMTYRFKGPERLILITDSMEATGCPDGEYAIAGEPVIVRNGRAETRTGALAGSTLDLWQAVKNLMRMTGAPLEDAVRCATLNPATATGIADRVGSLEAGKRADLLLVDDEMNIRRVLSAGNTVWEARSTKE